MNNKYLLTYEQDTKIGSFMNNKYLLPYEQDPKRGFLIYIRKSLYNSKRYREPSVWLQSSYDGWSCEYLDDLNLAHRKEDFQTKETAMEYLDNSLIENNYKLLSHEEANKLILII